MESIGDVDADPIADLGRQLLSHVSGIVADTSWPEEAFRFGPLTISLRVLGARFHEHLTGAIRFAGLPLAQAGPKPFRVLALDSRAAGVAPPPDWRFPVRQVRHQFQLHERPDLGLTVRHDPGSRTWRVVSTNERLAIVWTANAAALNVLDDAAPLRSVLHWITVPDEPFLAHSAAIGHEGRGILLIGKSGVGKSTTVAAAVMRGMVTTGDDFTMISPSTRSVYALYNAIKLDQTALGLSPGIAGHAIRIRPVPGEKTMISLAAGRDGPLVPLLRIAAVVMPRVTGERDTSLVPASTSEALRAIVPSTIFLTGGGESRTLAKAARLLRGLPIYRCELGFHPEEAIDRISAFIKEMPA